MPKQIIIIMQQNYPFGQCEEVTNQNTRVLVRKIYQLDGQDVQKLLQKVSILRKLKNENMIKIESVLQQQQSIHFLFQYIPIKLQTWISNINDQFIQNFRDQLIKFSSFLANNYIVTKFQLKNIGMDQNYGAKYFLDINFEVDNRINREKLKSTYIRKITELFKPYILNGISTSLDYQPQQTIDRPQPKKKTNSRMNSQEIQDYSISPPTHKAVSNQEALSHRKSIDKKSDYYQEISMSVDSENDKIMQQFMNVLENEGDNEEGPTSSRIMKKDNKITAFSKTQNIQDSMEGSLMNSNHQKNNKSQTMSGPNRSFFKQQSSQQIQRPPQSTFHISASPQPQHIPSMQSMGRGINQSKKPLRLEMRRDSAQLQRRVKCAIQKSMLVIKKFKSIRNNSVV